MPLECSLSLSELAQYVTHQVEHFFPDSSLGSEHLVDFLSETLQRLEFSFSHIRLKYYFNGRNPVFDHLHTDQYATFLYFLANTAYRRAHIVLAKKLYALNKALHGVDIFYEVSLPDVFILQHPVGTVIGRATYSNYMVIYQRCSIGSNLNGEYPTFGTGVVLFGGTSVIGNSIIIDNVWLSINSAVLDETVPNNSIVFGRSPHLTIKSTKRSVIEHFFKG
jgi:serine O-acetyltransferase